MIKKTVHFLVKPEKRKYLFYFISFFLVGIFFLYMNYFSFFSIIIMLSFFILYEISFRYIYRKWHGKDLPKKFPLKEEDLPFESHPYLPWVYKKNYIPPSNKKICSEEAAGFMNGGLKTNNLRQINGPDGSREVKIPKPSDVFRIICLGDSATSNYVKINENHFISWPLILESKLKKINKKIEVNNCAQGAYNTNEILIKFLIDTIDTEPDMIILYHAFVNVRGYLTDGFERDFSHFRKTIPSTYPKKVKVASFIPTFGLWVLRYLVGEYLSYFNIKEDFIRNINKNDKINREKNPEGLDTFRRNLETLIYVCQGKKIQLILSTYCYYLYDEIKNSPIHIKFHDLVQKENNIIRELASKHSISIIEVPKLLSHNKSNFIDEVHLNEKGMEIMADLFYAVIKNKVKI